MKKLTEEAQLMIERFNAHAKLYGLFRSLELLLLVIIAIIFWYGIYIAVGDGSMITAKFYVLPTPIYIVVRYFLHKAGSLLFPFVW